MRSPERHGLVLVVGHVEEGDAHLALDALELDLHGLANLRVEGAHRLVEQQDARLIHQRARQRDALLLSAGQLRRGTRTESPEAEDLQVLLDQTLDLVLVLALSTKTEGDVVEHAEVREERVGLEDRVDVALDRAASR